MALLVTFLTVRLVLNLAALGGSLRRSNEPPHDPFDVVYILEQLEAETSASMGWAPGSEDPRTRTDDSELVSDHDLMVLNELKERKERLEKRRATEEKEKMGGPAEEEKAPPASGSKQVERTGGTAGGAQWKGGGYFAWLGGRGEEEEEGGEEGVAWPPPVYAEQTHIRLQNGNMSEATNLS
jgi:hypothetical protein